MIGKKVIVRRPHKLVATVVADAEFGGYLVRDGRGEIYYAMRVEIVPQDNGR